MFEINQFNNFKIQLETQLLSGDVTESDKTIMKNMKYNINKSENGAVRQVSITINTTASN